jgi:enoyl-CoA hydratase/carnithine racemase
MNSPIDVCELRNGVSRIVLNDLPSRNALSEEMMASLQAALDDAGRDPAARAVIIAAAGPVFSSGHNLKQLTARRIDPDGGAAYFETVFRQCSSLMLSIIRNPKPVIAEVQGMASAAGCQLVATCDLAVASENAAFCTPGVNIGLFCSTPMVALSRNLARKHAMAMLLTGEVIRPDEARHLGLVNRVVPAADLTAETRRLAEIVAAKSMLTVKIGKEAFYRQREMGLEDAYAYTSRVMAENMLKRDAEEGISAFIEKRPPAWKDS